MNDADRKRLIEDWEAGISAESAPMAYWAWRAEQQQAKEQQPAPKPKE